MSEKEDIQPSEPTKLYDPTIEIYDPTGLVTEMPHDSNLMSWLKTAFLVGEALKEHPDDTHLIPNMLIIEDAIRNRVTELSQGTVNRSLNSRTKRNLR